MSLTLLFLPLIAAAQELATRLDDAHVLDLLDASRGATAIVSEHNDSFFRELSVIDLEARLGARIDGLGRNDAIERLKTVMRQSVRNWSADEAKSVSDAARAVHLASQAFCPPFIPAHWKFVKTDGSDEGGAAYTRSDAIILPQQKLPPAVGDVTLFAKLVAHETAHVYCRMHPKTRAKLFERIGFRVVGRVALTPTFDQLKLTNPDGPVIDSVIRLSRGDGSSLDAAMLLYAKSARFDPQLGRYVFGYLQFGLGEVHQTTEGWRLASDTIHAPGSLIGFYDQVGRNTSYIIGPDEIVAENLALFLAGSGNMPAGLDPRLPQDLAEIIRASDEGWPTMEQGTGTK